MNTEPKIHPFFYPRFFMNVDKSDVTLKCGKMEFPCHSTILKDRCAYFKAMLESGMKESHEKVITIKDTKSEVFKTMLHYIYCNDIPENSASAELIILADQFDLPDLIKMIMVRLINRLRQGDLSMIYAATLFEDEDLKKTFLFKAALALKEMNLSYKVLFSEEDLENIDVQFVKYCCEITWLFPYIRTLLAQLLKVDGAQEEIEDIKRALITEDFELPFNSDIDELIFHDGVNDIPISDQDKRLLKTARNIDLKAFLQYYRRKPITLEITSGLVSIGIVTEERELLDICAKNLVKRFLDCQDREILKAIAIVNYEYDSRYDCLFVDSLVKIVSELQCGDKIMDFQYKFFANESYGPNGRLVIDEEGHAVRFLLPIFHCISAQKELREGLSDYKTVSEKEWAEERRLSDFNIDGSSETFKRIIFGD